MPKTSLTCLPTAVNFTATNYTPFLPARTVLRYIQKPFSNHSIHIVASILAVIPTSFCILSYAKYLISAFNSSGIEHVIERNVNTWNKENEWNCYFKQTPLITHVLVWLPMVITHLIVIRLVSLYVHSCQHSTCNSIFYISICSGN